MIIGITGKSGSGKNYFAETLIKMNPKFLHLDIDKIGHSVLEHPDVIEEATETFGDEIFTNRKIDRKKLGELIFNCRDDYEKVAELTWKHMSGIIDAWLRDEDHPDIILNWILLSKSHYLKMCDVKYLIKRDDNTRAMSAMSRDGISKEEFELRDRNSIEYNEDDFDYVVINKGGVA